MFQLLATQHLAIRPLHCASKLVTLALTQVKFRQRRQTSREHIEYFSDAVVASGQHKFLTAINTDSQLFCITMMATFDEAKLDPIQYTLENPLHAVRLQATAEAFMEIVRTNPAYFEPRKHLIVKFCILINHDKSFPLAAMVVPELRRPQSCDTSAKTIINIVLGRPKSNADGPRLP